MDYIKAYNKVMENYSVQIDFINFIDSKLTELDINTIELEKQAEEIREITDMIKDIQILWLKDLNRVEKEKNN